MKSTNKIVANALASNTTAENSAYTEFGLFKDYKTYAAMELDSLLPKLNEIATALKNQAVVSKRGAAKKSEQELIDACYGRCLAALKEAQDRIRRQSANVMQ